MTTPETSTAGFFEERYRRVPDPWHFAWDPTERRRFAATVDALPRRRYRHGVEPGCANGELTVLLAPRCDRLDAFDFAPSAVARARDRCAGLDQVHVTEGSFPDAVPAGPLDLVVLSEIGYYLDRRALSAAVDRVVDAMAPEADLVAVHWLGHSDDHVLHGHEVHDVIGASDRLIHRGRRPDDAWRLDVWRRR